MKKYIGILIVSSSLLIVYAADLTKYQNVQMLQELTVSHPTVVEIAHLKQHGSYIVVDDNGQVIQQQIETVTKTRIIPPQSAEGCTNVCKKADMLVDGQSDTTFDFPLFGAGIQHGVIKITYAKPLLTDAVVFETTGDSYMPSAFTLTIDGKRILNTTEGGSARFPKMTAQTIEISFEYNQPIRFTEVGIGLNKETEVTDTIRFVYQPKSKYMLYFDSPTGRDVTPYPLVNLFAKSKEAEIVLGDIRKNPLYKERDSDTDGVVDAIDSCPLHANSDQKDGNGNGIGDVCDDYDYDGVITYKDNCPEIANQDQKDTDRDGLGDMCDTEESRVTEKYPWMPWAVFIGVFALVSFMVYEAIKIKKERQI